MPDVCELSDETLVRQTLAGNDPAFAELARRHHAKIAGMATRFSTDPQQADDLIQDIFIRAWRKLRQFRAEMPFEHWLSRLAIRQCYDLLRKRRRQREDVVEPENWERMRELAAHPNDSSAAREWLHIAMRQLHPEERMVITLLELEDKSVRETSALTGWSEGNVKVRAFRARQKLKIILQKLDQ